jgi:ComF family protein
MVPAAAPLPDRSPLRGWRRLLAPHCAVCHGDGAGAAATGIAPLCAGCRADFFAADVPRCPRCALRLPGAHTLCGRCLREPPSYDATLALADYRPPVDGLVVALKFGHRLELADLFGALLAERLHELDPGTLLVPVPLAHERQAERGFNQAEQVARRAARACGLAVLPDALLRTRHGPPQEGLDAAARRRNVRQAFAVNRRHAARLAGAQLAVVDDVMTSGATLEAVASALKQAGAARVTNVIVARTP